MHGSPLYFGRQKQLAICKYFFLQDYLKEEKSLFCLAWFPNSSVSFVQIFYSKFNRVEQEEIMGKMLSLYEHELGVLTDLIFHENTKDKDKEVKS